MCYNVNTTSGCGCNNGCDLLTWLFGNGCQCRNNSCACSCSTAGTGTATTQNGCGCCNRCNNNGCLQNTAQNGGCCCNNGCQPTYRRNNWVCVTYCGYANPTTFASNGDAYYARQYGLTSARTCGCGCNGYYNG